MPHYFLKAVASDGFIHTKIVQNLGEPTQQEMICWLGISEKEAIETKVERLSDCYGCVYNCADKQTHTNCFGCLHDKNKCWACR